MLIPSPVTSTYEQLSVEVYPDATSLGEAAAEKAAQVLHQTIKVSDHTNIILATGNSQLSFFKALRQRGDISWTHVRVFHMDEYVGLPTTHPASFRTTIRKEIVEPLQPGTFYGIEGDAAELSRVAAEYAELLERYPADLCCMGIGENGHLAFNDPPLAKFDEPEPVKVVELSEASRRQQVGEGHFPSLDAVPKRAITLTIPTLLKAKQVLVVVPDSRKALAVRDALEGPITEACPASILRRTPHATLLLDRGAASLLSTLRA